MGFLLWWHVKWTFHCIGSRDTKSPKQTNVDNEGQNNNPNYLIYESTQYQTYCLSHLTPPKHNSMAYYILEIVVNKQVIYLAGGCFWCTEAVFQRLKGVISVVSGYIGGTTDNPTYEQVCTGNTGHAEAIEVTFDPKLLPLETLLEVFWELHDPTTLNRQGADEGTQYRSAIFYKDENQKTIIEKSKATAQTKFQNPIVTEVSKANKFFVAEKYHENYYDNNKSAGYCRIVIDPKIQKLYKEFSSVAKPA